MALGRDLSVRPPVLLAHGMWDTAARIAPLAQGLQARGAGHVVTFDFKPNDGRAPIPVLAQQLREQADALRASTGQERIDLVGFSMGALVARYYLQRCGGTQHVRRFISISGPHAGTLTAYALPLAGIRQMRPNSALLRELQQDPEPFGDVEVHCMYTAFDLMIVPQLSSVLRGARSVHRLTVPLHRWMISDAASLDRIAHLLR